LLEVGNPKKRKKKSKGKGNAKTRMFRMKEPVKKVQR